MVLATNKVAKLFDILPRPSQILAFHWFVAFFPYTDNRPLVGLEPSGRWGGNLGVDAPPTCPPSAHAHFALLIRSSPDSVAGRIREWEDHASGFVLSLGPRTSSGHPVLSVHPGSSSVANCVWDGDDRPLQLHFWYGETIINLCYNILLYLDKIMLF